MAAKSKVSQPRFVNSWTPNQAWYARFSSVTDGNRGKADVVATRWQQVFTRSARKKSENKTKIPPRPDISRLQIKEQKG